MDFYRPMHNGLCRKIPKIRLENYILSITAEKKTLDIHFESQIAFRR